MAYDIFWQILPRAIVNVVVVVVVTMLWMGAVMGQEEELSVVVVDATAAIQSRWKR